MTVFTTRRASGNAVGDTSEKAIMCWADWYTRDLEPRVREDRLDELHSDLWEQRTASPRSRSSRVGFAMMGRAVRGVPGDLTWRQTELRADPALRGIARGWSRSGLLAITYLVAFVILTFTALAWTRILAASSHHQLLPSLTTMTSLGAAVITLICGAMMLGHARRRWLAALWLGVGTVLALHFGFVTLWTLSATTYAIVTHATMNGTGPVATALYWLTLVMIAVFFLLLALAWAPPRHTSQGSQ